MFIEGFDGKDGIITEFEAPLDALNDATVYYAKYSTGNYEGQAFVLFEIDGKLYEVNAYHCSCYGLGGQWNPEETTMKDLEFRWFQKDDRPAVCDSDEDVRLLKRIVLGEMFEQNVLLS